MYFVEVIVEELCGGEFVLGEGVLNFDDGGFVNGEVGGVGEAGEE